MSGHDQLLRMYDETWDRPDESVRTALKGVTPAEAKWQHPAYAREEQMPGMPAPGTILWQIAHLAHSARHYAEILRHGPVSEEPRTPPPPASTLSGLRANMQRDHAALRAEIAGLSESDLRQLCTRGTKVGEFLRMVIRHDTWHAGQIVVIRRLYRTRRGVENRNTK